MINVLFIAVLVVIAATLFWDVFKKRKRLKTAEREGVELAEALRTKLPEGYAVLADVFVITKLGRSRIDYVIVSPNGIFALEYRELYVYIRADEEGSRWTFAPGIKGKPFTSPLYQSQVHLHCIKELIGDKPGLRCYPMAAFPTVAEIELKNPSETNFVGLVPDVIPFIEKWHDTCLTSEEVSAIAELLALNSEKVKEMEAPEPAKETPEEYKAFIPADFREPEDEDDEEWDDEDEQSAEEESAEEQSAEKQPAEREVDSAADASDPADDGSPSRSQGSDSANEAGQSEDERK